MFNSNFTITNRSSSLSGVAVTASGRVMENWKRILLFSHHFFPSLRFSLCHFRFNNYHSEHEQFNRNWHLLQLTTCFVAFVGDWWWWWRRYIGCRATLMEQTNAAKCFYFLFISLSLMDKIMKFFNWNVVTQSQTESRALYHSFEWRKPFSQVTPRVTNVQMHKRIEKWTRNNERRKPKKSKTPDVNTSCTHSHSLTSSIIIIICCEHFSQQLHPFRLVKFSNFDCIINCDDVSGNGWMKANKKKIEAPR